MFQFTPIEPRDRPIDLVLGENKHVIVCFGNPVSLLSLVDYLGTEQDCGTHAVSSFMTEDVFKSLAAEVRAGVEMNENRQVRSAGGVKLKMKGQNLVIWITDENARLPFYAKDVANLVFFGEQDGSVTCLKDRSGYMAHSARFRCTGASSPTGRLPMPSSPAMHNMRPSDSKGRPFTAEDTSWRDYGPKPESMIYPPITGRRDSYSMGTKVKEPECPMCEAGLPLVKFEERKPLTILCMSVDKVLTLFGPDGREFIKINAEGEAFVRGEKVAAAQADIYEMFRAWTLKTAGGVPLPKPGVPDAQGEVFTPEAVEQLRKQVDEHGLLPMPKREFHEHENRVVTKTGHDITDAVKRDLDKALIRDLYTEMSQAARAWENGLHVGDIMQRLVDIAEGRVRAGSDRGIERSTKGAEVIGKLIEDVDSDPHITDSLRARLLAALRVR